MGLDMNIRKVAVIGAGLMGSGIAQVVAQAGFEVIVRTRRGRRGLDRLYESIRKGKQRKTLTEEQVNALLSKINWTTELSEAGKTADLVIEAVVEDLEIKKQVFRELDAFCPKHTFLTSNTSSLSISELADATKRPDKVIGMHFFNPVHVMKLIEVVPTSLTSKETVETVEEFSRKIGKTPVLVKESPGFVVNRVLIPMINEAVFVLMEGIATAETIDSAMKLGANHPIGPLALADLIGLDVCLTIMDTFYKKFKTPKYKPCPLLKKMVEEGYLGRKTGKGFFAYR